MRALAAPALLLALATLAEAHGSEFRPLYRGARAMAMGGAFAAVADDEQAIFLNPAGMAGHEKHSFHYAAVELGATTDIYSMYTEGLDSIMNLSADTINEVMGRNIWGQAQVAPTLTMPGFGVTFLLDGQAALRAKNQALPRLTMGYQNTNGIQAAWGFSMKPKKSRHARGEFRVGVGAKMIWRRGGYRVLELEQLATIGRDTLSQVAGNYGVGYGLDLGTQYIFKLNKRLQLSGALVFTDIGDTNFGQGPDPVKGDLTFGLAAQYGLGASRIILAYDYKHMNVTEDWRKKSHIGFELAAPVLSLYGGLNQVKFTYGVGFDAWLFRVTALSYAEELGTFVNQDSERRWVLKLALKFDL